MRGLHRVTMVAVLLAVPLRAWAGEANIDREFGTTGGVILANPSAGDDYAIGVVRQADGKLVAAGISTPGSRSGFAAIRYDANGVLDTSYGTGGVGHVPFDANAIANRAAIQPDGKVVVAGYFFDQATGSPHHVVLARLTTTGAPDPTFGSGGKVVTDVGPSTELANGIAIQPDGRIVVRTTRSVLRYLPDGTLDPTFGTGGVVTTPIDGLSGTTVLVQPDGRIVVTGNTSSGTPSAVVVRYEADGTIDGTFGTGGIAFLGLPDSWMRLAVLQPDGAIVVAGQDDDGFAVMRVTGSGVVDPTFGVGGVARTSFYWSAYPSDAVLRPDGRIVVLGQRFAWLDSHLEIDTVFASYTPAGAPDGTFNGNGTALFSFGSDISPLVGMTLQPDGKIVAAGGAFPNFVTDRRVLLVRFGSTTCGDGVVQPGEQCDDGNADQNDCCSPACFVDAPSTPCDLDGNACTADVCDGSGTCTAGGPRVCGVCETCYPVGGCGGAPLATSCKTPTAPRASRLELKHDPATGRLSVAWTWTKGQATTLAELGDPTTATDYGLCLYGTSSTSSLLYFSAAEPAGGTCGTRPCWTPVSTKGFSYRDPARTPDGVMRTKVLAGPEGKAKATAKTRDTFYRIQVSLSSMSTPLRAQLRGRNGLCLEAQYSTIQATADRLRARSD